MITGMINNTKVDTLITVIQLYLLHELLTVRLQSSKGGNEGSLFTVRKRNLNHHSRCLRRRTMFKTRQGKFEVTEHFNFYTIPKYNFPFSFSLCISYSSTCEKLLIKNKTKNKMKNDCLSFLITSLTD